MSLDFERKLYIFLACTLLATVFIYTSVLVNKPIYIILLAFFPTIIVFAASVALIDTKYDSFAWTFALLSPLALIGASQWPIFMHMDTQALMVINIVLSLIVVSAITAIKPKDERLEKKGKQSNKKKDDEEFSKDNRNYKKEKTEISETLLAPGLIPIGVRYGSEGVKPISKRENTEPEKTFMVTESQESKFVEGNTRAWNKSERVEIKAKSLEEKCKAINTVIGRVYKKKRGGSKNLRKLISISPELYNTFSKLMQKDELDSKAAIAVLSELMRDLELLENSEKDVFGSKHKLLRGIKRAADGSDAIIDVMQNNDTDPVKTYHKEAKEVCHEIIQHGLVKL